MNQQPFAIDDATVERARSSSTATIHEAAGQCGALPSAIRPVAPGMRVCGVAVTVDCPPGDNLWLHRALYTDLPPFAVLVASVRGAHEAGYWGEILAHAAMQQGVVGLVIDGCVRDSTLLAELGFPVFARGLCIRGTTKHPTSGGVNKPIVIGDVEVCAGDLVLGDGDGVVVISADRAEAVLLQAESRDAKEAAIIDNIHAGERTLDIYGFRVD
jgi:4-hydroxy-4-methyl-2-oxoglutarate aldolase